MAQMETERAVDALIEAIGRDDETAGVAAIGALLNALFADLRRLSAAIERLAEKAAP